MSTICHSFKESLSLIGKFKLLPETVNSWHKSKFNSVSKGNTTLCPTLFCCVMDEVKKGGCAPNLRCGGPEVLSQGAVSSPEMQAHSWHTWPEFFLGSSPWLAGIWQIFLSWFWLVTTLRPLSERKLYWPHRNSENKSTLKTLKKCIWMVKASDRWPVDLNFEVDQ